MSALEDAAAEYVTVRLAAEGSNQGSRLYWLSRIDGAWHELQALVVGCDCGCGMDPDFEEDRPVQDTLPL